MNEDLKVASFQYQFDSERAVELWHAKCTFTCILIARWAHGILDKGSRWIGLILSDIGQKNTYIREGLLIGPAYEDELLGWEKRSLKII